MPTVPADLLEAMVTAEAMRKRVVDAIAIPRNCLDVLAQHVDRNGFAGDTGRNSHGPCLSNRATDGGLCDADKRRNLMRSRKICGDG